MLSLIGFELKKMLLRRVSLLTSTGVALLMCGIMALNVMQTQVLVGAQKILKGPEAIAYIRSEAQEHAGTLTPEKIQADLEAYRSMAFADVAPEEVLDLSDERRTRSCLNITTTPHSRQCPTSTTATFFHPGTFADKNHARR
jgi:hypothetical protein